MPARAPSTPRDVRRRLAAAFAALIALLLVIVAVSIVVTRGVNRSATDKYVDDAIPLKSAVQDLVLQMVTQQSAVRGYVITRSPANLTNYRLARAGAARELAYIEDNLDGHPVLAGLIGRARVRIADLSQFYEAETAADAAVPSGLAEAQRRVREGTRRFQRFRSVAALMLADTDKFVADARAAQDRRTDIGTVVLLVLGALALGIAALLLAVVPRRVAGTMEALEEEQSATALAALRAGALQRMTAALATALDEESVTDVLAREVAGTPGIDEVVVGRASGSEWIEVQTLEEDGDHGDLRRLPRDSDLPIPTAARTGEAMFFPDAADAVARFPGLVESRGAAPTGSWAILPLRAGRGPAAALALRFDIPRAFTAPERTFLLTLADQVAQALDRVRLHQEQVHIAHVLQQSLLPAELPLVAGLEIAARYSPAVSAQEVGGDFYDVFDDGAGRLAIVVGDACGKGPEAASLTALARYTVRAVAMAGAGPAQSLGRLNAAIRSQGFGTLFMTAAQVALTVEDGRVGILACRAGHPHPLIIRASGAVEEIGESGRLLGIFDDPGLSDVEDVLGPGDALAVFTDGLTEARQGKVIMGEEGLRRAAVACGGMSADECADHLLRAASDFAGDGLRDDVVVVVVRVAGGGPAATETS